MDKFWVDSPQSNAGSGYDRGQGYSGLPLDEDEYGLGKKKSARDPMSHRIIEKRRRDRMNNCLADLSRLLPASYMKKGRGRIEKTEIIEMAIRHLRHLQAHGACQQLDKCDIAAYLDQLYKSSDQYKKGYNDCMTETVRFMSQAENVTAPEATCTSLMNHLRQHCDKVLKESNGCEGSSPPASESDASTTRSAHTRSTSSSDGPQSSTGDSGDSRRGSGSEDSPMPPDKGSVSPNADFEPFCRPDAKSHHPDRRLPEENGNFLRRPQEEILNFPRREKEGLIETSLPPRRLDGRHTPPTSPSCSSSSEYGNHGSYKFKNNIKQRFVADVASEVDHRSMSPRGSKEFEGTEVKRPRLHVEEPCAGTQQMWQTKQEPERSPVYPRMASKASVKHYDYPLSRPGSADITPLPEPPTWQRYEPPYELESLPIFALHPKGTFYVPMSIELALVEPLFPDMAQCSSLLHQVSISVNFSMPAKCISKGIVRDPVKRSMSSASHEVYAEQNRGLITHMEPPQARPWEDVEEREMVRFPPGMKNRYDSGSSGRSDESVLRRSARVEPPSATDPARWSLLMANARRSS